MELREMKIRYLMQFKKYDELRREIAYSKKYNFLVIERIFEVLESNKENIEKRTIIRRLILVLDDEFKTFAIDRLIRASGYNNFWLKDLLINKKIWDGIGEKQDEYLIHVVSDFVVPPVAAAILDLYKSPYLTDEQRKLIQRKLLNHLEKNPHLAGSLGFYQQTAGIKIITTRYLEGIVISNSDAKGMYELMECDDSNKKKLLNELGKIKDLSGANKRFFLQASARYFPEELSEIPFGEVIYQLEEEPTESYIKNGWFDYAVNQMKLLNKKEKNNGYSKTLNKK